MRFRDILFLLSFIYIWQITLLAGHTETPENLKGFRTGAYFDEQEKNFRIYQDVRIYINAPSTAKFDPTKRTGLVFYPLPNGNTIEQTAGKLISEGDDWHFNIQHIAAQTRFLRQKIENYNLVVVYLEVSQRSWPAWKNQYPDYAVKIKSIVDSVKSIFQNYDPFIMLSGHSGGGRFLFSYLDNFETIPNDVERICFLDSNYGHEEIYGMKITEWLNKSGKNHLCVLAYNDSIALYNGEPFVSPTGGTWYRSKMLKRDLSKSFNFITEEDTAFIRHYALNNRVQVLLKKNPNRKIFHTYQVERNGFIHSILSGTEYENSNYKYYGQRAYNVWVSGEVPGFKKLNIPTRQKNSASGLQFMESIKLLSIEEREKKIYKEICDGNLPQFIRNLVTIQSRLKDTEGIDHTVKFQTLPDYMAIGSNEDFYRIPMGPRTAQKIANLLGCSLPTSKLVDDIYKNATVKLEPTTYYPVGNANEQVDKFIQHNQDIEQQRLLIDQPLGSLIAGIKKDVVISNKIDDPLRKNHVVIYGWHRLDGKPIQPLTNVHIDRYVDYSHGTRLINSEIFIDGVPKHISEILEDPILFKLLSDEEEPMSISRY